MGRARLRSRRKVRLDLRSDSPKSFRMNANVNACSRNCNDISKTTIKCNANFKSIVGEIISCDSGKKRPKQRDAKLCNNNNIISPSDHELYIDNKQQNSNNFKNQNYHYLNHIHNNYLINKLLLLLSSLRKPIFIKNKSSIMGPLEKNSKLLKVRKIGHKLSCKAQTLKSVHFPFQVAHQDGNKLALEQWNDYNETNDVEGMHKDFLNKRQFRLTCITLALLAFAAACSPIETEAFSHHQQQQQQLPSNINGQSGFVSEAVDRNARSLSSYDFKDWLPGSQQQQQQQQQQPATLLAGTGLGSPPSTIVQNTDQSPSSISPISSTIGSSIATSDSPPIFAATAVAAAQQPSTTTSLTTGGSSAVESQLMAPMGSSLAPDHMLTAASKKKKKMKMMKKKKKMEKKHKEWKKGKKHKKKKYESKKKKGGSSKKKKGKKEKKKWGMEKKGHKKKGNFKKKKWGSKKKMKKGHKKGKKGHKLLKDKGHKKKGFKKVYHKEEWGKKKKWHDIKREKKWNTKAKKWKKKWHQEKGKKYKGKHMKKYHKKNKHGKKYKKEKKSKWKKHKGEKFKKGHKKKKEEYSKKKEGGKKKKMKKMKKEMKKKKKG